MEKTPTSNVILKDASSIPDISEGSSAPDVPNVSDAIQSAKSSTGSAISGVYDDTTTGTYTPSAWDTFVKFGLIFVVLAFLGINLFSYFGYALDDVKNFLSPVLSFIGYKTGDVIKQTADVTAEGVKGAVNATTSSIETGVDTINKGAQSLSNNRLINRSNNLNNYSASESDEEERMPTKSDEIAGAEKALQQSISKLEELDKRKKKPAPTETKGMRRDMAGYCYIGMNKDGERTCAPVSPNQDCASGEFYSTEMECLKPNRVSSG